MGKRTPGRTLCSAAKSTWLCCVGSPLSHRSTKSSASHSSRCAWSHRSQRAPRASSSDRRPRSAPT
eukprot:7420299-Lingulodinium_polyedra.AAC.1